MIIVSLIPILAIHHTPNWALSRSAIMLIWSFFIRIQTICNFGFVASFLKCFFLSLHFCLMLWWMHTLYTKEKYSAVKSISCDWVIFNSIDLSIWLELIPNQFENFRWFYFSAHCVSHWIHERQIQIEIWWKEHLTFAATKPI